MGGAREARAPHFFIYCNFSFISLFQFFGKVGNFQKINFPFFHFFDFFEISRKFWIYLENQIFIFSIYSIFQKFVIFWDFCKMALTLGGWTT